LSGLATHGANSELLGQPVRLARVWLLHLGHRQEVVVRDLADEIWMRLTNMTSSALEELTFGLTADDVTALTFD
jgi:hypothetical protein